jgi:hypothetical protein
MEFIMAQMCLLTAVTTPGCSGLGARSSSVPLLFCEASECERQVQLLRNGRDQRLVGASYVAVIPVPARGVVKIGDVEDVSYILL